MRALERIRIDSVKTCTVYGTTPAKTQIENIYFDGFSLGLRIMTKKSSNAWFFDTGAQSSHLFSKAARDAASVEKTETQESVGSAGGSVTIKTYKLKEFEIYLNATRIVLKNISLYASALENHSESKYYYGVLGLDVLKKYKGRNWI